MKDNTSDRGKWNSEAESDKDKENGDNTMKDPWGERLCVPKIDCQFIILKTNSNHLQC